MLRGRTIINHIDNFGDAHEIRMPLDAPIIQRMIVLEGIDVVGKTTQCELLERRFRQMRIPVRSSHEPTNDHIGKIIRRMLFSEIKVEPETLALLYAADRYQHLYGHDGMKEQADSGWVICDRYLFSSLVYQGAQCKRSFVEKINSHFPLPQYLIYIDIGNDGEIERRLAKRNKRSMFEHCEQLISFARAYRRIVDYYSRSPMRIVKVDGSQAPEKIGDEIWKSLDIQQSSLAECRADPRTQ